MHTRPDRPLVVKCAFDRWNKRISFASARNCSYELLRSRVEQCFSLYATSYVIAYKDDDGEITDITTESDLTEAIQYFQAGSDDPPLSSAASILSGRSFGSRRITLRVHITVDYDGPSLSDTSSLASMEEYKGRNRSEGELSWSIVGGGGEVDDDSVTVSSRDTNRRLPRGSTVHSVTPHLNNWIESGDSSSIPESSVTGHSQSQTVEDQTMHDEGPFADHYQFSAEERSPEDPVAVFERLKLQERADASASDGSPSHRSYSPTSVDIALARSAQDRGAAWLRDQNARTIRAMLGATPEPSESDSRSISLTYSDERIPSNNMEGDLALERDPRGKYYYSYTGASSTTHDSGYEDNLSVKYDADPIGGSPPRPNSMQLIWIASQQKLADNDRSMDTPDSHKPSSPHYSDSDPFPYTIAHDIPPEVLQFVAPAGPPPGLLTTCSDCGVMLDGIRYVCAVCGEKEPLASVVLRNGSDSNLGKGKARDLDPIHSYPPLTRRTPLSSSPSPSTFFDAVTLSGSPQTRSEHIHNKPLPFLPGSSSSSPTLYSTQSGFRHGSESSAVGFELCSGCIESAGVIHALRASTERRNGSGTESTSPADDLSSWSRSAPRQKGQLRHAYFEKVWGHHGWEDVEQDDMHVCKCSTCNSTIVNQRYKCASCQKFNLCRACYGQVHDIHPSHAFLVVAEKPVRSRSEPEYSRDLPMIISNDNNEERSMKHPGVKCAHCLQDILGARFHCAICDSVDICSNCESAGLPGNLDSSDGGHISSHIMIKIPYPLETTEVQTASRRAIHLWTGRDAAHVMTATRSQPGSVYSSYAQTVVGSRHARSERNGESLIHHSSCKGCNQTIVGIRYQCATCPSSPTAYSLCQSCEQSSYAIHDPMHSFFKIPRPVHAPLESPSAFLPKLYKVPAGPVGGLAPNADPQEYLYHLVHSTALCDRCMERIQGAWYRCAYCAKDLCGECESLDTHDETHIFVVFKAPVDMVYFRRFANLENPNDSPPIITFPVYC
ncbi:uncharacterized protein EDB91DRAFT_1166836 [Suillus paluster]|uniref:uncharacterized protein n=1 Tax=Suillus paluster TaxID=48578 RepID=UPI001B864A51|nr:uncharacterized protein EDB91DRAFT_1171877 [Suillus paluster]XP_041171226.1 uncharacterized protein EDB91DRAFT_1166836 [Suillus paluster]KAG1723842.1 hypothetical protein EDB91DRAFT_1171877 [Suillus paluster]KAG1726092.1 hypothetical protein EDB91DRAFT_1166836 [Suillus paluster]